MTWGLVAGNAACGSDSVADESAMDGGEQVREDAGQARIDGAPSGLNDAGKPFDSGPYDCPATRCTGSAPVCWGDIYCCGDSVYECQGIPPECAGQPSCPCILEARRNDVEDGGNLNCFELDCWEYDGGFYIECGKP